MRTHRTTAAAAFTLAFMGWGSLCSAAETAAFLKVAPGARPVAMGEAFTAVADDLNALSWNPAGMALLGRKEAAFMHAELFEDTRYDFIGYGHPLSAGALGTLGFGFARLSQGSIEARTEDRRPAGSFEASDTLLQAAYARRLAGSGPLLGISVKYLNSSLAGVSAQSAALDFGLLLERNVRSVPLSLGFSVMNLGPGMRFLNQTDELPLAVSLGAGVRVLSSLRLAADFRHRPRSGESRFGLGTEYMVLPALTLRAGYSTLAASGLASDATADKAFNGLGMGLGLRMGRVGLDYAFTPAGELGTAQRFSLSTKF
ncbi:MAG: PorV/PorQ family protein [Elusimicrobiota bacterium]